MLTSMFKSKIHGAIMTDTNPDYNGSIEIDGLLLDAAGIYENEQVHVWCITNGQRLITYAIRGKEGSGVVAINGAGAKLMFKNDIIIIATFGLYDKEEIKIHKPVVLLVDNSNQLI